MNQSESRKLRKEITKLFGRRKLIHRPVIQPKEPTYPWRSNSLGKSKFSEQGVAGWRTTYHRPPGK